MNDKILVTGSAGFIGFHLSKSLLDDGFQVFGIDNINNYYDTELKDNRLKILTKYNNFSFKKIDLLDADLLDSVFRKFKPNKVVNLAAQAGVRYSIENPHAYINSNIVGFVNIIECCRYHKIKGLIYASSSSVYGNNKKIPFSVNDKVDNPISLYAATEKANELIAHSYSHLYNLHTTGLRFFTAYGPWGSPDMAMYLFVDNIINDTPIQVFNNGNMKRDFTYVDDIIKGTRSAIDKNYKCEIFNLGNNKSEKLMDVISLLEHNIDKKSKIIFKGMQPGDIQESFSDIDKSIEMLNYKPQTNIDIGIKNFVDWYMSYNKGIRK